MSKRKKHRIKTGFEIREFVPNLRDQAQEVLLTLPQISEEKVEVIKEFIAGLEEVRELTLTSEEIKVRVEYWKEEEFRKCAGFLRNGEPLTPDWKKFREKYRGNIERLL